VVLEFDKDAPPTIALLHSGRQCKDVVEKERRITGQQKSIAKVAMGRNLGVRLYWMWRNGCEYLSSLEFGSYVGPLGTGHGTK
jgi:hypothetical protein